MKNNSHRALLDRIQQRKRTRRRDRPGLRRLAAGARVLPRRLPGHGVRRGPGQGQGPDQPAAATSSTSRRRWCGRWSTTGRFAATSDMSKLSEPDAIIICVPTPLTRTKDPDLQFVEGTAHAIAKTLRPGQLVSLESTTYPGTTRDVVKPILEADGPEGGEGLLAGLLARARGSGPQGPLDPHDPEAGRRHRAAEPGARARPVRGRWSRRPSPSSRARSPRPPRSSRTSTAA